MNLFNTSFLFFHYTIVFTSFYVIRPSALTFHSIFSDLHTCWQLTDLAVQSLLLLVSDVSHKSCTCTEESSPSTSKVRSRRSYTHTHPWCTGTRTHTHPGCPGTRTTQAHSRHTPAEQLLSLGACSIDLKSLVYNVKNAYKSPEYVSKCNSCNTHKHDYIA